MNSQREVIYTRRRHALFGERLSVDIANMIHDTCFVIADEQKNGGSFQGFDFQVMNTFAVPHRGAFRCGVQGFPAEARSDHYGHLSFCQECVRDPGQSLQDDRCTVHRRGKNPARGHGPGEGLQYAGAAGYARFSEKPGALHHGRRMETAPARYGRLARECACSRLRTERPGAYLQVRGLRPVPGYDQAGQCPGGELPVQGRSSRSRSTAGRGGAASAPCRRT